MGGVDVCLTFRTNLQVAEVENTVNEKIQQSLPVHAYVAPLEQASQRPLLPCVSTALQASTDDVTRPLYLLPMIPCALLSLEVSV